MRGWVGIELCRLICSKAHAFQGCLFACYQALISRLGLCTHEVLSNACLHHRCGDFSVLFKGTADPVLQSHLSREALKQQQKQDRDQALARAIAEGTDVRKAEDAVPCPGFSTLKQGFREMLCGVDVVLTTYNVIEVRETKEQLTLNRPGREAGQILWFISIEVFQRTIGWRASVNASWQYSVPTVSMGMCVCSMSLWKRIYCLSGASSNAVRHKGCKR